MSFIILALLLLLGNLLERTQILLYL